MLYVRKVDIIVTNRAREATPIVADLTARLAAYAEWGHIGGYE
jgi:hypothetical protein